MVETIKNNNLLFSDTTVEKRSASPTKLRAEVEWFERARTIIPEATPEILKVEYRGGGVAHYATKRYGGSLSELIFKNEISAPDATEVLLRALAYEDALVADTHEPRGVLRDFVHPTLAERLPTMPKHFFEPLEISINGVVYPNPLRSDFERLLPKLAHPMHHFVHGDLHLGNILVGEGLQPILIDPRGAFGPIPHAHVMYDLAKLNHDIMWGYNHILSKNFVLEELGHDAYRFELQWHPAYQSLQDTLAQYIEKKGETMESVNLYTFFLFLSLIPLHKEEHQLPFFLIATELYSKVRK